MDVHHLCENWKRMDQIVRKYFTLNQLVLLLKEIGPKKQNVIRKRAATIFFGKSYLSINPGRSRLGEDLRCFLNSHQYSNLYKKRIKKPDESIS